MCSRFQDANLAGDSVHNDHAGLVSLRSTGHLPPKDEGILGRARKSTWWIHKECADPAALLLLRQMNKPRDEAGTIGERLVRALPEGCEAKKTRRELCALFEAQFRHQPETAQLAIDEIQQQVKDRCGRP